MSCNVIYAYIYIYMYMWMSWTPLKGEAWGCRQNKWDCSEPACLRHGDVTLKCHSKMVCFRLYILYPQMAILMMLGRGSQTKWKGYFNDDKQVNLGYMTNAGENASACAPVCLPVGSASEKEAGCSSRRMHACVAWVNLELPQKSGLPLKWPIS